VARGSADSRGILGSLYLTGQVIVLDGGEAIHG
jgi:hypothetical protein